MAPLLRSKTSSISSPLRDALPLPAPRSTLFVPCAASVADETCVVVVTGERARAAAVAAAQARRC